MKHLLIVLLVAISFTGCLYQTIDQTDLMKAQVFCKSHMGIKELTSVFDGTEQVECIDGTVTSLLRLPVLGD